MPPARRTNTSQARAYCRAWTREAFCPRVKLFSSPASWCRRRRVLAGAFGVSCRRGGSGRRISRGTARGARRGLGGVVRCLRVVERAFGTVGPAARLRGGLLRRHGRDRPRYLPDGFSVAPMAAAPGRVAWYLIEFGGLWLGTPIVLYLLSPWWLGWECDGRPRCRRSGACSWSP